MFIRSVDDLSDSAVAEILARADEHASCRMKLGVRGGLLVGLVFLDTSLRTRIGFSAAAARLGAQVVEVVEQRHNSVSMSESVTDTLRTVAGYVDALVARVTVELSAPPKLAIPLLNAGDGGPFAEHPTQALVDFFALQRFAGPVADLSIAVCGDLRMRSIRSLLKLLARHRPQKLLLISDTGLEDGFLLPPELSTVSERRTLADLDDADVLYVAGIPHGAVAEFNRTRLRVTPRTLASLRKSAIVLSPLPVIDEISADAYADPRIRMFEQSDEGLFVRMAVVDYLLDQRIS